MGSIAQFLLKNDGRYFVGQKAKSPLSV